MVLETDADDLVLIQEVIINAPVDDVWQAYTTSEGWTAWVAPRAEVDLRLGGTILTSYEGEIGGAATNRLEIVNYVPRRLLSLKPDYSPNWPDVMKNDGDRLINVVVFETQSDEVTIVKSYGIGYKDAPEYDELMGFFIQANESLYANLIQYVENGVRVEW